MSHHPIVPAILLAAALPLAASAASARTDLTIYRTGGETLFQPANDGPIDAGFAMAREPRELAIAKGNSTITLTDLPHFLNPEAVTVQLPGDNARILSRRLQLAQNGKSLLEDYIGQQVTVRDGDGQTIATGKLLNLPAGGGLLLTHGKNGRRYIRNYASIGLPAIDAGEGASLTLDINARKAETVDATLVYPTSGLSWHMAYTGLLEPGADCRLHVTALASIANRSGRDWNDVAVKLVAGEPHHVPRPRPQPFMMRAMAARAPAAPKMASLPQQAVIGDYRMYTLAQTATLPNGSITQLPLYAPRTTSCTRTWSFVASPSAHANRPLTARGGNTHHAPVTSFLRFTAWDSFPAGDMRIMTTGSDGDAEFTGADRVSDTAKGQPVTLTLGKAFDLGGSTHRTAFEYDKDGHALTEGFRVDLHNAGKQARTIAVRVHPYRWRSWKLLSSSIEPSKQTPDLLEFAVKVPASGKAELTYTLHYQWTKDDE